MNKNLLGIIITVVALAGVGVVVAANQKDDKPATTSTAQPAATEDTNPFTKDKTDMSSSEVQSGTVAMDIKDFAFSKESIKIKKGTKVVWTNQDSAKHDVTPDSESPAFKASELLAKGEAYEFTFDTVGTYSYKCSPHPYMKASVEVVE